MGTPLNRPEAMLATPRARISRFDWCRVRVSASTSTQVLRVSIESRTDRVRAGPAITERSEALTRGSAAARAARSLHKEALLGSGPMRSALPSRERRLGSRKARPK